MLSDVRKSMVEMGERPQSRDWIVEPEMYKRCILRCSS